MSTAIDRLDWGPVAFDAVRTYHAVQKESELAALLTLLHRDIKPHTVLEIGSDLGGSLYAWGALPSVERVYAVTLGPPPGYTADYHGATVVLGDSHSPETYWKAMNLLTDGPPDFVFIDGDHSSAGCAQDVSWYGWWPSHPHLCVLHDIVVHPQFPDCRVHEVWAALHGPSFHTPTLTEIVHEPRTWGGFGLIRW